MLIVGELINASRKRVGEAIANKDDATIRRLARRQRDAGADVIDLNAGESLDRELEDLLWLIEIVEDELGNEVCLGIDTSDPDVMGTAIAACSASPILNSISNEPSKRPLYEIAADRGCEVIGLAMGERGMPTSADDRVAETAALLEKCAASGIDPGRLYVDQICMSVASDITQGRAVLDAVRRVGKELAVKTLVAVSNVSFGLPGRRLLNRTFLAMLVDAGLEGAILDPTDPELMRTLCASRALVGADEYCIGYIRRHRAAQAEQAS